MRKLLYIAMLVGLASCGKQDPFDGYPDDVRNAVPPGQYTSVPQGISSNLLLIDGPDYMTFQEKIESSFSITGKALLDRAQFKIESVSLPKGATYNPTSGEFKWMPSNFLGAAISKGTSARFRIKTLQAPFYEIERSFPIVVTKTMKAPKILAINNLNNPVVEGTEQYFDIIVDDPAQDANNPPTVVVTAPLSEIPVTTPLPGLPINQFIKKNAAPYIQQAVFQQGIPLPPNYSNGKWTFRMMVIAQDPTTSQPIEVTSKADTYYFNVHVITAVGTVSSETEGKVVFVSAPRTSVPSWNPAQPVVLKPGSQASVSMTVYTKYGDNKLSINNSALNWPGSPTLACAAGTGDAQDCILTWNLPDATQLADSYKLQLSVVSSSDGAPGKTVSAVHERIFKIQK